MRSSPWRTPQPFAEQPSTGECWIPPKKDTPHPRAKKKPSKMVGGVKLHLESNPITPRDARMAQTLCTPGPRDPIETETELCLNVSGGGMDQQWPASGAGVLGATDLGRA